MRWKNRETETDIQTNEISSAIKAKSPDIVEWAVLDKRPKLRYAPSPIYSWPENAPPETVLIDFYVDKDGGVQLPAIKSAKDVALGWAAATAVKRWVFEVPTFNGKPTVAHHELAFNFK